MRRPWCVCRGSALSPGCYLDCRHVLGSPLLIWSLVISSLRLSRRHPSSLTQVSDSLAHCTASCVFGGTGIALSYFVQLPWLHLAVLETPGSHYLSVSFCLLLGLFPENGKPRMLHFTPAWGS